MGSVQTVPFLDLRAQHEPLRAEIDAAIARVFDSAAFVLGPELDAFEAAFAEYCGVAHAVGVGSGTAALHLALEALGVGPGDEVITVPNTFVATVEAIRYTGATPVLVDVEADSFCMDPDAFERAITPRTRAVVPVHLYGCPCRMDAILDAARRRGVAVVEDACQAHGARWKGRRVGALGDVGAFSFYPTKNLGAAGDGGMVVTNDAALARRVRALRHHAQFEPNVFAATGYNSRLDSVQAAVLGVKLPRLDGWNARRREIAARVHDGLCGSGYAFQRVPDGAEAVYHILAARHPRRSAVLAALDAAGIGYGRHVLPPVHRQPGFRQLDPGDGRLATSERLAEEIVSLPVYPELTDDAVDRVIDVLTRVEVSV